MILKYFNAHILTRLVCHIYIYKQFIFVLFWEFSQLVTADLKLLTIYFHNTENFFCHMSLFGNGGYEKCHLSSDCRDLPYRKKSSCKYVGVVLLFILYICIATYFMHLWVIVNLLASWHSSSYGIIFWFSTNLSALLFIFSSLSMFNLPVNIQTRGQ